MAKASNRSSAATASLFDLGSVKIKKAKPQTAATVPNPTPKTGFANTADLLNRYRNIEQNKYVTQEFQSFGCHIAEALDDKAHTSLYIKLAKQIQRGLLERALSFVSDANADNKAKLFMWKLNQLKQETVASRA
jgi:hypothetical protein